MEQGQQRHSIGQADFRRYTLIGHGVPICEPLRPSPFSRKL